MATLAPAEITVLIQKIAAILEEASDYRQAWRAYMPDEEAGRYRHTVELGSLAFSIENARQPGRLHISGETPRELREAFRHASRNTRAPSITVSADRSPREIAKEITRRVLPEQREYIAALQLAAKQHREREQARKAAAEAITAALEAAGLATSCRQDFANSEYTHISPANYPGPSFTFQVSQWGSVELKASITPACAVQLAAILATAERPA